MRKLLSIFLFSSLFFFGIFSVFADSMPGCASDGMSIAQEDYASISEYLCEYGYTFSDISIASTFPTLSQNNRFGTGTFTCSDSLASYQCSVSLYYKWFDVTSPSTFVTHDSTFIIHFGYPNFADSATSIYIPPSFTVSPNDFSVQKTNVTVTGFDLIVTANNPQEEQVYTITNNIPIGLYHGSINFASHTPWGATFVWSTNSPPSPPEPTCPPDCEDPPPTDTGGTLTGITIGQIGESVIIVDTDALTQIFIFSFLTLGGLYLGWLFLRWFARF